VHGSLLGPPGVVVPARLEALDSRGSHLTLRVPVLVLAPAGEWAALLPSQRLVAGLRLLPAEPGEELAALATANSPPRLLGEPSVLQRAAGRLRSGLRDAVRTLGPAERGLVPGLVDGDAGDLPPEVEADFRAAGLTHLIAVSGANVAFVLAAVLLGARWLGVRGRLLPVIGLLGLGFFLVLARPEPSVLRATAMGVVAVVATGRRGRSGPPGAALSALLGTVVLLVLFDPFLARSLGFVLSAVATAGLLVLAPVLAERWSQRVPARWAQALAVPVAAQLAVAPILVLVAPSVSLVAIPANLLAEPAVPAATVLGVLAAVVAPVSSTIAGWFGHLAGLPARWIVAVAGVSAGVPAGNVSWPGGATGALLLVAAMGAVVLGWRLTRGLAVVRALAVVLLLLGSMPTFRPTTGWPPPGWVAIACDVGQGDALVLSAGPRAGVVVDAGPDPKPVARCLDDLGIRSVPLLLLTHFHADHVEGVPGVLTGRAVGEIEVSPLSDPPAEAHRVRSWAAARGIPVRVAAAGERRSVGGVSWQVVWPTRLISSEGSPPNQASVVLLVVSHGVRLLLTGDVETAAQHAMLTGGTAVHVDVLKVPHHGSRNQDPSFLRAVDPAVALVSVGVGNPYGHPNAGTLATLVGEGAVVGRTDSEGALAVSGGPGDVVLTTQHPP
jgi:competence protein ComEC